MSTLVKMSNCWKSHALARSGCSSDILTGITVFNYALRRLIHKSFITTANRDGERRMTLIFWLQVSGMTMHLQRIGPAFAWLQMTNAHNFFHLYAPVICDPPRPQLRGMSRTLTLCMQFPIVTTILWGS